MEIISLILIALVIICIIALIYLFYLSHRNEKVFDFRNKILHDDYEKYKKLPSYDKMFYSFKPLKEKYWIK